MLFPFLCNMSQVYIYIKKKKNFFQKFILRSGYCGVVAAHLFGVVAGQVQNQQEFEKVVHQITNIKNLVSSSCPQYAKPV